MNPAHRFSANYGRQNEGSYLCMRACIIETGNYGGKLCGPRMDRLSLHTEQYQGDEPKKAAHHQSSEDAPGGIDVPHER